MKNNEEYEKIQQGAKYCVIRQQYIEALSKINTLLNTQFLSDNEFLKNYRLHNLHPFSGIMAGALLGLAVGPTLLAPLIIYLMDTTSDFAGAFILFLTPVIGAFIGRQFAKMKSNSNASDLLKQYAETRDFVINEKGKLTQLKG